MRLSVRNIYTTENYISTLKMRARQGTDFVSLLYAKQILPET